VSCPSQMLASLCFGGGDRENLAIRQATKGPRPRHPCFSDRGVTCLPVLFLYSSARGCHLAVLEGRRPQTADCRKAWGVKGLRKSLIQDQRNPRRGRTVSWLRKVCNGKPEARPAICPCRDKTSTPAGCAGDGVNCGAGSGFACRAVPLHCANVENGAIKNPDRAGRCSGVARVPRCWTPPAASRGTSRHGGGWGGRSKLQARMAASSSTPRLQRQGSAWRCNNVCSSTIHNLQLGCQCCDSEQDSCSIHDGCPAARPELALQRSDQRTNKPRLSNLLIRS
jgi:hypothetical protein